MTMIIQDNASQEQGNAIQIKNKTKQSRQNGNIHDKTRQCNTKPNQDNLSTTHDKTITTRHKTKQNNTIQDKTMQQQSQDNTRQGNSKPTQDATITMQCNVRPDKTRRHKPRQVNPMTIQHNDNTRQ